MTDVRVPSTGDRIGWVPSGTGLAWAAVGGVLAAIVIGVPMTMLGMMVQGPAALVGSDRVVVGWIVHLLAGVVFGAPLGLFLFTRKVSHGIGYGLVYGLAVGAFFAWLALFAILDMPLFSTTAVLDVMMHVVWGGIVGATLAWGLAHHAPAGVPAPRAA